MGNSSKKISLVDSVLLFSLIVITCCTVSKVYFDVRQRDEIVNTKVEMTDKDMFPRLRSIKLFSDKGSCSGEQIITRSGSHYILTAAHCKVLEDKDGNIKIMNELGEKLLRRIVAEDDKSDLLLLEGLPNFEGLKIASGDYAGEKVRTFTHGAGYATYKTEGEIVQDTEVKFLQEDINLEDCTKPKNKIVDYFDLFRGGSLKVCTADMQETVTTAKVVPGSSGGMVVDNDDNLVGVVSATDGDFGYIVRLIDIQSFLAGY